jgi:hypothetical protein
MDMYIEAFVTNKLCREFKTAYSVVSNLSHTSPSSATRYAHMKEYTIEQLNSES